MKIGLGCDHGGYNLKLEIIEFLKSKNIEYLDFGTNNGQDSVDYPISGEKVANAVADGIGTYLEEQEVPEKN